ncbi:MAG: tetratricopeptide repeat protein, partial [Gemmataceae bacterium]
MRKINGKLFLALLVGTAVAAVGLFFLHRVQRGRIASALLFQAKKADDDGNALKAGEFRQRYLEFNKNDHAEMANLARQWAGDGVTSSVRNRKRAADLLDKVLTTVEDRELRKLLIKTALGLRDYLLAREHLNKLLPVDKVTESVAALRAERSGKGPPAPVPENAAERGLFESYWGQLLEVEKQPLEALDCYRLAARHAPAEVLPYVRLAYLLRRRTETDADQRTKNVAEADAAIDRLVSANDATADSYLTRWRYRRDFDQLDVRETANKGQVRLEAAAEDIAQALKRKPDAVDVLLCAADLERLRSRAASEDGARSEAQRKAGMKAHRDKAFDYLRRGLEVVAKDKAGRSAEESGEFQLLWHKGNLLLDDLDPRDREKVAAARPEMDAVIEQIRKTRINGAADYMAGRQQLIERKWAESAVLFERARTLLATQPDLACQADLFLGQCYGRLEEHTQMYNAFKRVSDWDPSSVAARIGMAEARLAQGQLDDARAQFDVLIKQQQMPARAWLDAARLEIQRQMTAEKPAWDNAERLLAQAEETNPRAVVEIPLLRAEMLMRQDRTDEARKELRSACDRCPDEVDLWAALADCALRRNKPADAKKVLDDAQERLGDRVGLRLVRCRVLGASGKLAPADVEALAARPKGFTDAEQARLLSGLADACLRANEAGTARRLYARLAELPVYRNDLKLHLLQFDLALREQDEKGMEKTLDTIQGVEQASGTYHRYGTALLKVYRARRSTGATERGHLLEAARAELDVVQKARPSWASVFLARAEIATLVGNPDLAIKNLQEAIKNGESSPGVIRRLVSLLGQTGRTDEAQALVNRLNKSVVAGRELSRIAAALAIRSGNVARALDIAQSSIREDSRDTGDLVYMARVLSANRRYDEAEKKLADALAAAPGDPEANLARVQFLVERKRKPEAERAILDAEKNVPAAKRPLVLAQCYDVASKHAEAMKQYALAAERGKDDPATLRAVGSAHLALGRLRDAEPVLRRLLGGAVAASADDLAWARRSLAMVLAGGTDYRRFTEALDLVGMRLDVNGKLAESDDRDQPSEAVRARARVLASQAQKPFRDRAIGLFEGLDRKGDLTADDRFVLAMLYEADGKAERSQSSLRQLTQTPVRTPRYLAQYAMSLLATRRDADALADVERAVKQLEELEKLREVGPNGFASVELHARLLEAQKKDAEARDLIKKHVTRTGARPEEVLLLIGTLSRQKQFKEAFALCEATWEKGGCPSEPLGAVSVSLLRVMGPTDAQSAAVEERLTKALAGDKPSTVLRMQLADLLDRRGKYDESSRQWREVLKAEPNNFVAMNNLAWLLVTHGGDAAEALRFIDRALTGMGRRADLLDTRGLIHLAMKDTGKALADFKDSTADGPTPARLLHLARAQHLAKDREAAKAALTRAKEAGLEVAKLHPTEQEPA